MSCCFLINSRSVFEIHMTGCCIVVNELSRCSNDSRRFRLNSGSSCHSVCSVIVHVDLRSTPPTVESVDELIHIFLHVLMRHALKGSMQKHLQITDHNSTFGSQLAISAGGVTFSWCSWLLEITRNSLDPSDRTTASALRCEQNSLTDRKST